MLQYFFTPFHGTKHTLVWEMEEGNQALQAADWLGAGL
jgi:hypothetical protein